MRSWEWDLTLSPTLESRFQERVTPGDIEDCWLWTGGVAGKMKHGHFNVGNIAGVSKSTYAHRVAWFLATGEWPELHVLHKCDVPRCCNPYHLFLGTAKDNSADMIAKGRGGKHKRASGERHGRSVFTVDQVKEIKQLLATNVTKQHIADKFGVSHSAISHIAHGRVWKSVTA